MGKPAQFIKRFLPRGLFGRSLIIIVAPVVLLQCIISYAFFVRHYDVMTQRMGRGVAADGRYERFKTTMFYDGEVGREQHGFPKVKELPL